MPNWALALQALNELGLRPVVYYALYHEGLRSGYFRRALRAPRLFDTLAVEVFTFQPILKLPDSSELAYVMGAAAQASLLAQADEIVAGQARLFGGVPQPMNLVPQGELYHWTAYELGKIQTNAPHGDIKFIWEPARFGWAIVLGRAYHLTKDEHYPEIFWTYFETFIQHNPPYQGPNWVSAQEVALRLIALTFAGQVFAASAHSTPQRRQQLAQSIAWHAQRIPPTLVYARSQNNNHLLSEAVGLFTAALVLPRHPQAPRWRKLGWNWFQKGIHKQVTPDGVYMQQSTNYHRLMLQLALWMDTLCRQQGLELPEGTRQRLAAATRWLLALLDPVSGQTPNLGANDGAYILPFSTMPFTDYRPVAQAAAAAFLHKLPTATGVWDEMRLWFNLDVDVRMGIDEIHQTHLDKRIGVLRQAEDRSAWAYLRLAEFHDRPGHADLLHVDLWYKGENLALDAGTFLYNSPPPWDNALTRTQVHNTVMVDNQEQMRRAGRFLYLDWAKTKLLSYEKDKDGRLRRLTAQHDGYASLNILHQRMLVARDDGAWLVEDQIFEKNPDKKQTGAPHLFCLQWLVADYPWHLDYREDRIKLSLAARSGKVELRLSAKSPSGQGIPLQVQVVRAGQLLFGEGDVEPSWGWASPYYGEKIPALAIRCYLEKPLPVSFTSYWSFSDQ